MSAISAKFCGQCGQDFSQGKNNSCVRCNPPKKKAKLRYAPATSGAEVAGAVVILFLVMAFVLTTYFAIGWVIYKVIFTVLVIAGANPDPRGIVIFVICVCVLWFTRLSKTKRMENGLT